MSKIKDMVNSTLLLVATRHFTEARIHSSHAHTQLRILASLEHEYHSKHDPGTKHDPARRHSSLDEELTEGKY
jgi:hypothetical protein